MSLFRHIMEAIALFFVFASLFEYLLHRFVMHKPVRLPFRIPFTRIRSFEYPFEKHACVHHHIFKADETYHCKRDEDKKTIPMAWWNRPVLILIATAVTIPYNIFFGHWWTLIVCPTVFGFYYWRYERMHWCMHLPKARRLERSWLFRRLNGHHLLHHRQMGKNFNVVFPLFDLIFGTLVLRSKTHFKQATCPALPDVQPKVPKVRPRIGLA